MNRAKNPRRQTLGPVSVNLNVDKVRADTVDPSNPSNVGCPKARPPTGRASMIPRVGRENIIPPTPPSVASRHSNSALRRNSVDRRQSLAIPSAPSKTDPRNVTDKVFQQTCIKKILKYLLDNGYDHPISQKSLARPSGKDFNHIVTFLLRQIDPNFQDGPMKIEDEIALSFKALGYPFTMSKTSLVAAGSPHAWPSLLAALTWLTEHIICVVSSVDDDTTSPTFESLEELEIKTDKAFFRYLSASYTAFLRGDEQATEQLELTLAEHFENDDEIIEKEIEQMTDKNAVIVEQINNLTISSHDLQEYVHKRDGYVTDLAQFHDLINQMDNHVNMLCEKKNEKCIELEESSAKLSMTSTKIGELKNAVRTQDLSLDGVRNLQSKIKGIIESIDRLRSLNQERRNLVNQKSLEVTDLWNIVEEHVSAYNGTSKDLTFLLARSESEPAKLLILNNDVVFDGHILGKELERMIENRMLDLKESFTLLLAETKRDFQEKLDEFGHCEDLLSEASESLKIFTNKTTAREETLENERHANNSKCGIRLKEVEALETRINNLRDPVALEEKMAHFDMKCAELRALRLKNCEATGGSMKVILTEIEEAISAIDHLEHFFSGMANESIRYQLELRSSFEQPRVQLPN